MSHRRIVATAAAVTGIAAALVAGYAAAGATGLVDVASIATLGVLIVARGTVRGQKPWPVPNKKDKKPGDKRPADFPAYATIASDLEWARMSQRHYEHTLRPRLARLAATLGQTVDLTGPPARDTDGPGVDLATLERIITQLEGP
jgi:hypothetical protein